MYATIQVSIAGKAMTIYIHGEFKNQQEIIPEYIPSKRVAMVFVVPNRFTALCGAAGKIAPAWFNVYEEAE